MRFTEVVSARTESLSMYDPVKLWLSFRLAVSLSSKRVAEENEHLIKIVFELTGAQSLGDVSTETIWAEQVEASAFKVMNTPFHVTGLSFQDIVIIDRP